MKLIAGNSNLKLAKEISKLLKQPLVKANITRFADNEIFVEIKESVRGEDVFVIQSTSYPANDHVMELLIMADALKRASVKSITAVIPYYGYSRQDRKPFSRTPISAKLVADLLTTTGINRVLTLDLHAGQIQGFFNIPVDNLFTTNVFSDDFLKKKRTKSNTVVVSPDIGGLVRARALAKHLGLGIAIIDKRRDKPNESHVINIIGNVNKKDCIIVDDIVDSAGTLCNAAFELKKKGACEVTAYATHAVLSSDAVKKINNSALTELVVTDTIITDAKVKKCKKLRVISIAKLFADAISRISHNKSVSSLFN
ncbi:MAG: ribose-phosphate pyrophosphokinase [Rickettsiales bacterium]